MDVTAQPVTRSVTASGDVVIPSVNIDGVPVDPEDPEEEPVVIGSTEEQTITVSLPMSWQEDGHADGKMVYEPKAAEPVVKVPFLVRVSISDLNIRKGPGTDYDRVQFIPIGVYTIMEVRSGKGSSAGWGRLKSSVGWISLDTKRI